MTEPLAIFEGDLRPMQYWHVRAQEKVKRWATGIPEGYSTGFKSLDSYVRLISGELTIIAARPSQGKTALAMQMVESVAKAVQKEGKDGCVAVFSAEMSGWSLYIRMAAAMCGVNSHKVRNGKGTPQEVAELEKAMARIRALPIWVDDNSGPSSEQMLAQLAALNETNPVRMMMFDFMELGGDSNQREDMRLGTIAKNLKGIAKTLGIPVLALSQLNRDVETRANKMPGLADLRYSGMIEQVSDNVLFIMRPEYYVERGANVEVLDEADKQGVAYVQIGKNRNGPVGLEKLAFIKDRVMFADTERVYLNEWKD